MLSKKIWYIETTQDSLQPFNYVSLENSVLSNINLLLLQFIKMEGRTAVTRRAGVWGTGSCVGCENWTEVIILEFIYAERVLLHHLKKQ